MESTIRRYLEDALLVEFDEELTRTSNLFAEGVMDSFGYVQLIQFLEQEFHFKVTEEEIAASVLVDLDSMCRFVAEKAPSGGTG